MEFHCGVFTRREVGAFLSPTLLYGRQSLMHLSDSSKQSGTRWSLCLQASDKRRIWLQQCVWEVWLSPSKPSLFYGYLALHKSQAGKFNSFYSALRRGEKTPLRAGNICHFALSFPMAECWASNRQAGQEWCFSFLFIYWFFLTLSGLCKSIWGPVSV